MMMMMMMIERCCSFLVIVQGSGVPRQGFPQVDYLFVRRTVSELRGMKVPRFCISTYFSHTKKTKKYFLVTSLYIYIPEITSQNTRLPIITSSSGRSKGVHFAIGVSRDVWWGNWGPQSCPNFAYGKFLCIHNATTQRVRSGPKTAQSASFRGVRIVTAFWGCEQCSPKFLESKSPKTAMTVPWIGLSSMNDKNWNNCTCNTATLIMTKFLHQEWAFVDCPTTS